MSADVHSLVGAYAVDAIDEQERAAFELHLRECPECMDEVSSLRAAASSLSLVSEVVPPASMRDAVLAGIRTVRPLPPLETSGTAGHTLDSSSDEGPTGPVGPGGSGASSSVRTNGTGTDGSPAHTGAVQQDLPSNVVPMRRRRPVAEWLVGAAAAVALIAGGIAWSPWSSGPDTQQISASERVLEASDAQRVVQNINGAKVTIVRSQSLGKAVVIADNMPAAPDGKDFQFWFNQPNKGMVSAGVMPHGTAPTVSVMLDGDASTALAAGITLEPAGGSPEPTSAPLALFAFS
ncbi:anti-sigma factor [Pedococcus aerophilus]|uniref:Regulator of SigK n=1 Tax=Pedococcus aerophilus TaxID=436356 RepID=A0ABN3USY4_9MICO